MAVREGLLAVLAEGARQGYQVKTEFESMTGGVWTLNVGQVYTTLDRLERDGLVEVTVEEDAKKYAITEPGQQELAGWWDAAPIDQAPPRDELMLKVLSAIEHGPKLALRVITNQRTALTAMLQARRQEMRANEDTDVAARLVADALVMRAEADLRWLDMCEARVTSKGGRK